MFDAEVRRLTAEHPEARPFLCHGTPYPADVMLVGLNPGVNVPFWPFWNAHTGCDKESSLAEYKSERTKLGPTRRRIEILFDKLGGFRCVEANLFPLPSPRLAGLPRELRSTALFDYLLAALGPRLLYVHGAEAVGYLGKLASQTIVLGKFARLSVGSWRGSVYATRHLSFQWSDAGVAELGVTLRSILEQEGDTVVT